MLSIEQRIWQQATLHPDKLAVKSGKTLRHIVNWYHGLLQQKFFSVTS